jgi:hypothetical protein
MKITPSQKEKRDKKKARLKLRAMNKKVKKQLKREAKSLPKKADDLWSKCVRIKGVCEVCGKKEYLNAHHIFSRHNKSTRWDVDN